MTPAALAAAVLALLGPGGRNPVVRARAARVAPVVLAEAQRAHLPAALMMAMAFRESGFRQDVVSAGGDVGLFQVRPSGQARYRCRRLDLHQLRGNARCAARILRWARELCGGGPERWLGVYAGVRRCGPSHYGRRVLAVLSAGAK